MKPKRFRASMCLVSKKTGFVHTREFTEEAENPHRARREILLRFLSAGYWVKYLSIKPAKARG